MTPQLFRKWGPESIEVVIDGEPFRCERGRLGIHLELGEILDTYEKEVEARSSLGVRRALTSYLAVGTGLSEEEIELLSFVEMGEVFTQLQGFNRLRFFPPFLSETPSKDDQTPSDPPPWDYEARDLYIWIHTLASTYGWSREAILELVPEEAVIYIQEIMLDEQFEREWQYGLSGKGVSYNAKTRTSRFKPLLRPSWMIKREPTVVRMPRSLLPVGNVIYGGEFEPQEVSDEPNPED